MSRILVAYVTHSGSTREVAEFLGEELRSLGHQVDVRPAREVADLAAYDAVVAGSLLYRFGWHRDMLHFLERHGRMLESRPVALFVTGLGMDPSVYSASAPYPIHFDPAAPRMRPQDGLRSKGSGIMETYFKGLLSTLEEIEPRSLAFFRGKVDMESLWVPERLVMSLIMRVSGNTPGDYRNWEDMRAWVRGLDLGPNAEVQ
ncbi:MAG: flavodoxin domain-containing protein [Anaerolineae bacterium]